MGPQKVKQVINLEPYLQFHFNQDNKMNQENSSNVEMYLY